MSLNICVLTSSGIHQSADFQVTYFTKTTSGWKRSRIWTSPKIVVITYSEWSAIVTYVGIAELDGISTADWLISKLVHPRAERSVADVMETIRIEATAAINRLGIPLDYPRNHTFTVGVSDAEGVPHVFMISNYQSLKGPMKKVADKEFSISTNRLASTSKALVTIAGPREAVTKAQKHALERVVKSGIDAISIRSRLAQVNERASQDSHSGGVISSACFVYSLFPHGDGTGEIHGSVSGELLVDTVHHGVSTGSMIDTFAKDFFAKRGQVPVIRGISMTSSRAQTNTEERRGGEHAFGKASIHTYQRESSLGEVLIAGGFSLHGVTRDTEIYDRSTEQFTLNTKMLEPRVHHSLVHLKDNRVFVLGGDASNNFPLTAEIYDPTSRSFVYSTNQSWRGFLSMVASLTNGDVLFGYYFNETPSNIEGVLYDASKGSFASVGSLIGSHGEGTSTTLNSGAVLIVGGYVTPTAELYYPERRRFVPATELVTPRVRHTATLLQSGHVLIAGGECPTGSVKQAELYDSNTESFRSSGAMTTTRAFHTATPLADGTVLIAGGQKNVKDAHSAMVVETIFLATAEIYDPRSEQFSPTGDMSLGRWGHTSTLLGNGEVLIVGGQTIGGASDTAEIYNAESGMFRETGKLGAGRWYHAAILLC